MAMPDRIFEQLRNELLRAYGRDKGQRLASSLTIDRATGEIGLPTGKRAAPESSDMAEYANNLAAMPDFTLGDPEVRAEGQSLALSPGRITPTETPDTEEPVAEDEDYSALDELYDEYLAKQEPTPKKQPKRQEEYWPDPRETRAKQQVDDVWERVLGKLLFSKQGQLSTPGPTILPMAVLPKEIREQIPVEEGYQPEGWSVLEGEGMGRLSDEELKKIIELVGMEKAKSTIFGRDNMHPQFYDRLKRIYNLNG